MKRSWYAPRQSDWNSTRTHVHMENHLPASTPAGTSKILEMTSAATRSIDARASAAPGVAPTASPDDRPPRQTPFTRLAACRRRRLLRAAAGGAYLAQLAGLGTAGASTDFWRQHA